MYWKSKVVQEALAKICSSFVPCELEQCRSCLYGNFTNPIKRLLNRPFSPYLGFKNDRKNERLSQTADVCIKIILSYRWLYSPMAVFTLRIRGIKTLPNVYPKYPVLDTIRFWLKNPD